MKGEILVVQVRETDAFADWLDCLRDATGRAKILVRIQRLSRGNAGDVGPVGEGISEMRIHYGPGYRVYYKQQRSDVIVLLAGGDKSTQARDIETAKRLANELKE